MNAYESPILTVDVVLLELREDALWVGVMPRPDPPFAGHNALIGGFVHVDKDADTHATALRVIRDKACIAEAYCEQLGTFSGPTRDPRGWSATVVYFALVRGARPEDGPLIWVPIDAPGDLAFDHKAIVQAAAARLRAKGSWSNLPAFLLAPNFTYSELRRSYEVVLQTALNDSAFRRKIEEVDLIEPVKGEKSKSTARPAQVFRLRQDALQAFNRKI